MLPPPKPWARNTRHAPSTIARRLPSDFRRPEAAALPRLTTILPRLLDANCTAPYRFESGDTGSPAKLATIGTLSYARDQQPGARAARSARPRASRPLHRSRHLRAGDGAHLRAHLDL